MARIEGIDVSHWNKIETIPEARPEFALIKLSEGKTFKDSQAMGHTWMCKTLDIPYGFYHYARAEKNTPEEEAEFFVSLIPGKSNIFPEIPGTLCKLGPIYG